MVEIARHQRAAVGGRRVAGPRVEASVAASEEERDATAVLARDRQIRMLVAVEIVDRQRAEIADLAAQADDPVEDAAAAAAQHGRIVAQAIQRQRVDRSIAVEIGQHGRLGAVADQIGIAGGEATVAAAEQDGQRAAAAVEDGQVDAAVAVDVARGDVDEMVAGVDQSARRETAAGPARCAGPVRRRR